jgi:hypothetical protein
MPPVSSNTKRMINRIVSMASAYPESGHARQDQRHAGGADDG